MTPVPDDVAAIVCLSVAVYATGGRAVIRRAADEHFLPQIVRELPHHTAVSLRHLPLTVTALLLILGGTTHVR